MPRNELQALLKSIVDLTPSVKELSFSVEKPFKFSAGQFVMLQVPGDPKPALRAYSVASPDQITDGFKLVIKHFDEGVASQWVRTLKGGEKITFTGPFGKFLLRKPCAHQVVMVCTSTGLAPLYSMMASLPPEESKNIDFKVFMGVWNEKEIFYKDKLENLKSHLASYQYDFVLDAPPPGWSGLSGKVTTPVANLNLSIPTEFYLCGNPHMIKAVKDLLLEKGFPKEKIYTESYG